jgi:nucleotide-binding universal stress UspA family protein
MKILLSTNGSAWANRALELGKQIALATASEVDVLVTARSAEQLEETSGAVEELEAQAFPATIHRRVGRLAEEVVKQTRAAPYDLVVVGSRGRRGVKRLFLGSLAARIVGHTPTSVMVVKGRRKKLKRFLVCSAAGPASESAIAFAGRLARAMDGSITLIHVMSQLRVDEGADPTDLRSQAGELIERRSREGVHLNRMLDLLAAEGTKARAVVRHGLVVDEIVAEAGEGQFDLVVLGAHVTPGINSLLIDNLAEQILLAADLPVLVVRRSRKQKPPADAGGSPANQQTN